MICGFNDPARTANLFFSDKFQRKPNGPNLMVALPPVQKSKVNTGISLPHFLSYYLKNIT